jgi:L-2,4-diaminobutyric acid acetyltransferase
LNDSTKNRGSEPAEPLPIVLRRPRAGDGPAVTGLIAASAPLDNNSRYCNLLQCTDFGETCVVAEREGRIVGWLSGYRPPAEPEALFVWQVAVHPQARGEGLALRMLNALVERPSAAGAVVLTTTITETNDASWRLFRAFARTRGSTLTKTLRFAREEHLGGVHDDEFEARIPLPPTPHHDTETDR